MTAHQRIENLERELSAWRKEALRNREQLAALRREFGRLHNWAERAQRWHREHQ